AWAADSHSHEHRPSQHRGGFGQCLRANERPRILDAFEQGVKGYLANDVAAISALLVQVMRVPFTENVVWPPVGGMSVIVGARIEGKLIEKQRIEPRLVLDRGIGPGHDVQGALDNVVIRAPGDAGAPDE